ncbi:MAG: NAD-dependent epimerase/dehydratase family protein [Planctomycetota bacterium]|jgi:nucleoside-diphosphate-sugar epimerase
MQVLVTGHLGYIGTVLTRMLVEAGFEVAGIDSDLFRRCTFCEGIVQVPTARKDIRDVELDDVRGFDAVIHLAALANDLLGDLNPRTALEINYRATVRLAELSRKAGVGRFLFSSSCSSYGASGEQMLTEQSPFRPVTVYAESKVLAEGALSQLATDAFSPVCLRNATAYGVSPRLRFDLVLNNLVAWGVTTGKILLKSDGTPWRPLVHVEDICRAFIAILRAPRELIHNEAFNVGRTDQNFQVRDLAQLISEVRPGCRVEFADEAGADARCYRVNCDKIARTLKDYRPQWDVRRGVEQLWEAYQKGGLVLEEFEGPRFRRVKHIRKLIEDGIVGADLHYRQGTPAEEVREAGAMARWRPPTTN